MSPFEALGRVCLQLHKVSGRLFHNLEHVHVTKCSVTIGFCERPRLI